MSTMFSGKRTFYHGLGCEMIKLEIIALKEVRRESIQQYRIEKSALNAVYRRHAKGDDISNVNMSLFFTNIKEFKDDIKELEQKIAFLKDSYHDLYANVYLRVMKIKSRCGPSHHEYAVRRARGDNSLSPRDIARGVIGWGRPNVIPGKPVDVSSIDTSKLSPVVLFTERGPTNVPEW